jgi:MFS superfamily sulfate permease-like transporter
VHGEIRADEFADDLARIEAKRPLRVVIDFSNATSIEAGAIIALLGLKRRLAAEGVFIQVIATGHFAAELAALESAHAVDEARGRASQERGLRPDDDRPSPARSRTRPEGDRTQ